MHQNKCRCPHPPTHTHIHTTHTYTHTHSGAEIEGLVKSATSFALNRQVDVSDLSKPIDEESIQVGARELGRRSGAGPGLLQPTAKASRGEQTWVPVAVIV